MTAINNYSAVNEIRNPKLLKLYKKLGSSVWLNCVTKI